ncbi:MAG: glycosyltransferase [Candidatus Bathyarchaeia archaeon]
MPEPALHFSVIFALSASRLGIKKTLILSAIALLPDLDALFHVHRSMSHSLIILGLSWLLILTIIYTIKREYIGFGILCFLALLSHPIMDLFQNYTPILYPILDRSLWVRFDGSFLISSEGFSPRFSVSLVDAPTIFRPFQYLDAPIFTSEGFLISLLLIIVPLFLETNAFRRTAALTRIVGDTASPPINSFNSAFWADNMNVQNEVSSPISKDMVTVVIPTLNEERGIGLVIDELLAEGYRNILVVDGYSKDRTVEIAKSKGANVVYQRGVGKAGAIITAIELVSTPYMLVMDGDYTYDPKDVERLLKHADNSDEVIGHRVNRENIPLLHRIGNWIISLVFSIMFGKRIRDPCSGMYLLRTDVAKNLEIASGGFDVEVEIAGQVASLGRIVEVPVSYRRRVGEGKLKAWRDGFRILMTAMKVMWLYNPAFLLSALVSILAVPGAAILIWQLALRYLYGAGAWSLGWSWFGLVLLIAGLQGITVTVTSLTLKRIERRILQALREMRVGGKN